MALGIDNFLKLARSAERAGNPAAAQRAYVDLLDRYPGNARARAALAALDQALAPTYQALSPGYSDLALLVSHYQDGRYAEGRALAESLLEIFPQSHFLHTTRGALANAVGESDVAIAALLQALAIKPDFGDAHYNIAVSYDGVCDFDNALSFYRRAVALRPDQAAWHTRLGGLYARLYRHDEAIAAFERAHALDPAESDALVGLGESQRFMCQLAPAIATLRRALALKPDNEELRVTLAAARAAACDWPSPEEVRALCAFELYGEPSCSFAMLGIDPDPARALTRARATAARIADETAPGTALTTPAEAADGRIRIGYFSADFHDHTTMFLIQGLFRNHDRSRFAVHAYSFGANRTGERREALRAAVDGFHDVLEMSDAAITALARDHGLDLAIDLKGYTANARTGLFVRRMAPVQVQWLGYPGTMGSAAIDYIVADPVVIPPEERIHYSEAAIRLPGSYQPNDNQRTFAANPPGRAECGLHEAGLILCCFNNVSKIGPQEFDIWMALLRQVPDAVLWLFKSNALAGSNLHREAEARGVDPKRLILAEQKPHDEHLARLRHADLFLDCFTYNAHTTASDALWAGVPMLTCAGRAFQSRVAASLLVAAGLPELVTHSPEAYAELALALSSDRPRLAELRAKLAAQREACALFDTAGHTRAVERAWTTIVERARADEPPADLDI
jgi:predicted O-linked N-acetylglucosamine transferase (SPINDLY family)